MVARRRDVADGLKYSEAVAGLVRMMAALAAVAFALAGTAFAAQAQSDVLAPSDDDEALIGTVELGPAPKGGSTPQTAAVVQAGLFHDALLSFETGQAGAGQRLLERAIAADPDSAIAAEARRRLGELYRHPAAPAAGPAPAGGAVPAPPAGAPPSRIAVNDKVSRTRLDVAPMRLGGNANSTLVPVPEPIAMAFLTEAGDRIFFGNGSAELGGRARTALSSQAQWLLSHPQYAVRIEGHSDDPPLRPEDQEALSEKRAEAVRQRLIEEGVPAERVEIVPWGREQRIAECDSAECSAQNRRAITRLVIEGAAAKDQRPDLGGGR